MAPIDTLLSARWIVPIEPAGVVLEAHSLAIHQGRILALLPTAQAKQRFSAQEEIERPNHVLLPGLVNAHTHAASSLLHGAVASSSFEHWAHTLRQLQQRWVDAEYVREGTELAIAAALSSGTTCFADQHLFPEVVAQTAAQARMRVCVGLPIHDAPSVWAGSADECLAKGLQLRDEYRDDPLITTVLAPLEPSSLSDETLERVRRLADELEVPICMHVNESRSSAPALERLQQLGLLSPLLAAVHMVKLDSADVDLVAAAGASVIHCPQSNLRLGSGLCPVPLFKDRSVNVALGSGGVSNNDLLAELRTAALIANSMFPTASPVDAHAWLQTATLNGARALGLADSIGSLLPGKWADLCCIDLAHPNTQPSYDPVTQIVFAASREQVSDVWVAGRLLLRDRELTHLDKNAVLNRAELWRVRIAAALTSE
ncbi:amidohydrolase family protein [Steroidobacter sp.]|uniref:amidohydrolase family protein n=1 Tax=Steroidobacter sp. TaxID=1978227 RepID=UPI001A4EE4E5|nr:amidohydrolase family protein [Steroidobacter sp.]MBL8266774.1 amidohydrolase family protein [Steroidobacter sp.]